MTSIPASLQTPASSTVNGSTGSTGATGTTNSDYMDFLHMLTTELQNQDPTSPMDTTAFTQQLIGFSQIQQQVQTNSTLTSLLNQSQTSNVSNAVSYIDRFVKAQSSSFSVTNNVGYISYNMPSSAASVNVSITDNTGKVLNTFLGTTTSGMHDYSWNAVDSSGNKLADGTYKVNVTALDSSGNAITGINTYTTGLITAVDLENGATTLHMGDNLSFTTDQIDSIEGSYATTPTVANPSTSQSVASAVTNAVSSAASTVSDALANL